MTTKSRMEKIEITFKLIHTKKSLSRQAVASHEAKKKQLTHMCNI